MARDIDKRLKSLHERRMGTDRIADLTFDSATQVITNSLTQESYAKRAAAQKHTKYALGAMQAVDPDYTRISLEEADRVKDLMLPLFCGVLSSRLTRLFCAVPRTSVSRIA